MSVPHLFQDVSIIRFNQSDINSLASGVFHTQLDFAILGGHLNLTFNKNKVIPRIDSFRMFFLAKLWDPTPTPPPKKEVLNVLRGSGQQPAKVTSQCSQVAVKVV